MLFTAQYENMRDEPKTILIRRLDILTCGFKECSQHSLMEQILTTMMMATALFALGIPATDLLLN